MPTRPLVTSYADDLKLFPDRWHHVGLVVGALAVLAFPFVADAHWLSVGSSALITVVGAVALMILTGFAGQISLGHAAFLALGAYTVGVLGHHWMWPFWLALPVGGLVAAAVGLAIGPFALRLEGLYLAIVTLGLLFLVGHVLLSFPELTGGVGGLPVPLHTWFAAPGASALGDFGEPTRLGPLELIFEQKLYFVFLLVAVLSAFASKNLQRSHTGRAMMAVRDHDLAAAVLGVDPARAKIIAFGVSSFLAGIAGGLFALKQQYLTVSPPFDLSMSVMYIATIVLGGLGTTFGAVAGAIAFAVLEPLAEVIGPWIPLVSSLTPGQQSNLLFALFVCVMFVVEPLGFFGVWLRIKRYFVAWPFRY